MHYIYKIALGLAFMGKRQMASHCALGIQDDTLSSPHPGVDASHTTVG